MFRSHVLSFGSIYNYLSHEIHFTFFFSFFFLCFFFPINVAAN